MGAQIPENPVGMPPDLGPGSLVAGYRLEERVGAGGMAVVFRAVDERLNRPVAVKVLAPWVAADAEFRRRFLREARAAAAVDDPHIIPVHEAGDSGGVLFIAMRFVPGRDVGTLLSNEGPLPPARVGAIISPVASALDAAHAAGLVHRDVKPANMLLDARPGRPDHVYLSDFGVAKAEVASGALTLAGQPPGTPAFAAPEQIEGLAVDGRADQYALACAAFQMLTGHVPFERDERLAVLLAHLQAEPPPLSAVRPGLPPAADPVFARALAKAPEGRYPTCTQFADALRVALGLPRYHSVPGQNPAAPDRPAAEIARQAADQSSLPAAAAAATTGLAAGKPGTADNARGGAREAEQPASSASLAAVAGPAAEAPPKLALPVRLIDFGQLLQHGEPPERRVRVGNAGGGALNARATTSANWLRLHQAGDELVVTVDTGAPGEHEGTVIVESDGGSATIAVQAQIQPASAPEPETVRAVAEKEERTAERALDRGADLLPKAAPGAPRTGRGRGWLTTRGTVGAAVLTIAATAGTTIAVALSSGSPGSATSPRGGTSPPRGIPPGGGTPNRAHPQFAYVANYGDGTVTPVNLATGRAGPPITVGKRPVAIAITPNGKMAYVANEADGTVTPINLTTRTPWPPITVGKRPQAIAITPDGKTAWVVDGGDNAVTPISLATGRTGTPIRVGASPVAIAINPRIRFAYVANWIDNTITPINLATRTALTPIKVGKQPDAIAVTPSGAIALVAGYTDGKITAIGLSHLSRGPSAPAGRHPWAIAVTPDCKTVSTVWVADVSDRTITSVPPAAGHATITVGRQPDAIVITADGKTAWVAESADNTISPVSLATGRVGTPIRVGTGPDAIALTPRPNTTTSCP
jgi:serine/threonine-protein kinase